MLVVQLVVPEHLEETLHKDTLKYERSKPF